VTRTLPAIELSLQLGHHSTTVFSKGVLTFATTQTDIEEKPAEVVNIQTQTQDKEIQTDAQTEEIRQRERRESGQTERETETIGIQTDEFVKSQSFLFEEVSCQTDILKSDSNSTSISTQTFLEERVSCSQGVQTENLFDSFSGPEHNFRHLSPGDELVRKFKNKNMFKV